MNVADVVSKGVAKVIDLPVLAHSIHDPAALTRFAVDRRTCDVVDEPAVVGQRIYKTWKATALEARRGVTYLARLALKTSSK